MIRSDGAQRLGLAVMLVATTASCDGKAIQDRKADAAVPPTSHSSRVAACTLMPKEEVSEIVG